MSNIFSIIVTKYFGMYLIKQRGVSSNTIKSYRDTFVQLLEFMECRYHISASKISSGDFTKERITDFLDYLERKRNLSISSRNQRLAAIHSFFRFLQKNDLTCFKICTEILSIEFKNTPQPTISYLSLDEIRYLFTLPNSSIKSGLRELAIIVLLYETGARVQELIEIKLGDISTNTAPTVILHGKGNKSRVVPISKDVASIIKKYIVKFQINNPAAPLFTNKQGKELTRVGVQYIINKYVDMGKKNNPEMFHGNISNHSFRHSKSMHLLEAGVNLVYIRDFLGHSSITTTEIYAKSNPEIKRKAIEKHGVQLGILNAYNENDKDELLSWLKTQF